VSTDTTHRPDAAARPGSSVELSIGGMTCASCAARIEKKLNRLDGVTATVNFATEKARVSFPAAVSPDDLIAVVQQAGYRAALPASPRMEAAESGAARDEADSLRQRLLVSLALAIPVVVLAMVPALQFRNWQWASLALASPVAVWGAWPFHRAALEAGALRQRQHHGSGLAALLHQGEHVTRGAAPAARLHHRPGRPGRQRRRHPG